ncbi:MAG: DNA polymerase/3'-5' exonuclease PolX [Syntrophaceae bacterium PtaU1.Bin231]|nr:MAG: DNA polymerase/3'-5' exonuclease PolX [Syntrophaceae bacterium PtaU1.Bin231]
MIDFHTHSLFSDGELIPAELVQRAVVRGYQTMAITDHGDQSNIDFIIPRVVYASRILSEAHGIRVIPGIELTHCHPRHLAELAREARRLGARIVIVHGETLVEPVMPGTNAAALTADIDILAHPGLLTEDEARLAKKKKVFLEITTRKGHSLTNGHVAKMARKHGVPLVVNTDSHSPADLVDRATARSIVRGAGLDDKEADAVFENARKLAERIWAGMK